MTPAPDASAAIGVVLAGGIARRMGGGDKGLVDLGGRPMLARVIDRLEPQVRAIILSANGDPARFAPFEITVVADTIGGQAGPLAGVLAAMAWARHECPDVGFIVSVGADTPFISSDLVERLTRARREKDAALALARSRGLAHPIIALWPVAMHDALARAMDEEGLRKVGEWTSRHSVAYADFEAGRIDPFFNVNTEADLRVAREALAATAD